MSSNSSIQWTDSTWTPLRARVRPDAKQIAEAKGYTSFLGTRKRITAGRAVEIPIIQPGKVGPHCEHVSPGCENCYSETNNGRCLPFNGTGLPFDRRTRDLVETFLDEKILQQPLHWRAPKKVFVCSQTDLFGEWVTDEQIAYVFAAMALRSPFVCGADRAHTFQVLTKRAVRMKALLGDNVGGFFSLISAVLEKLRHQAGIPLNAGEYSAAGVMAAKLNIISPESLPNLFPNVIGMVSVEDQPRADERIPLLLQTPFAVRGISAEPLLGPIDLKPRPQREMCLLDHPHVGACKTRGLDWVIVGGESGPGARPMNLAWAEEIVAQCQAAGVPVFVKQLGSVPVVDKGRWPAADWVRLLSAKNRDKAPEGTVAVSTIGDKKMGDIANFPPALQVRQWPEVKA